MKKLILLMVWGLSVSAYAVNARAVNGIADKDPLGDPTRTRSISKTFAASQTDKINLSNQFGSMVIKVWDRKEVKIDITISAYGNNEKQAQESIDQVDIQAEKTGDIISCKTEIDRENKWSRRNNKAELKVSYIVYVPVSNALTLSQQFGSIHMPDYSGALSVKVQYGNFVAGKLTDNNNYISVQYGKATIAELNKATIKQQYGAGLEIGTVGELNLTAQYAAVNITAIRGNATIKQQYGSGLKIGSVNNLDLSAQYVNVNIGTIKGDATIKQQYNNIEISTAGQLTLKAQYAGVTVGSLRGNADINMTYNNFSLSELGAGCKNLVINAAYSNINMGFASNYNGEFNLQKSYGGFRYGNNVKVVQAGDDDESRSSSKNYAGRIGHGAGGNIRIKASYGSVTFK